LRTRSSSADVQKRRTDWRVSHLLEAELRRDFESRFGRIVNAYWCTKAYGGGLVTERGHIESSLSSRDSELMTIEVSIKQLARDAQRVFAPELADGRPGQGSVQSSDAATLPEISATLFSALSRVLDAADVLEDPSADDSKRRNTMDATRAEWRLARTRAAILIQRQAAYEYFIGVLIGTPIALALYAGLGVLASKFWQSQVSASSLIAATICGALGATVSVTQRMAAGRLRIDYTASVASKRILGAWRPILGGLLGAILQFAIIGGLLTVQGTSPSPESPAIFAFYALVGFAGGFSERLAIDLLERTGQLIAPSRTEIADSGQPAAAKINASAGH